MSVAVFGTDRLRFTSAGTRSTTLRFSHPNSARSNAQIQAALRARQVGAGIITVTDHNTANTVTVTITMPADAHQPADGSTDLWEWNDGTRTYRSGPLAWRWDTDRDPAVIDVDIAFGFGAQTFPAHTYRPGWGLGLTSDLTEAITGYRVSRLNPLREAKIVRGRSHELAAPQPARAVIVLDDTNGYTDPDNADAPAPYRTGGTNTLIPGLPIRMLGTAPGGGTEQIIFTGIIERIRQDYPGHTDERVVLECVDTYKLLGQGSVDATQPAVTSLDAAYQAVAVDGGLPEIKSGSAPYDTSPPPVTRVGAAVAIESYIAEAGTTTASELRNFERATASQLRISRDGSVEALMPSNFLELPGSYVDVGDGTAEVFGSGPALVCGIRWGSDGTERTLADVVETMLGPPSPADGTFTATNWTGTPLAADNYLAVRVSKLTLRTPLSQLRVRWPSGVDQAAGVAIYRINAAGDAPDWDQSPHVHISRPTPATGSTTSALTDLTPAITASSSSPVTVMVVIWHAEGTGGQQSATTIQANNSGSYIGANLASLPSGWTLDSGFRWRHHLVSPLRYSEVDFARDDDRIINKVQIGTASLVADSGDVVAASRLAYGVRLLRIAESPLTESEQVTWAIGVIRRWAQPVTRLQQMTLKPREVTGLWRHVLAVDVAEGWRVCRTSPAAKVRYVPVLTERVEHHITATDWTTKLQGTSVNPLDLTLKTFSLTEGGTEYCVGSGEDLYMHRVFAAGDDATVTAVGSAQVQIILIAGGGGGGYGRVNLTGWHGGGGGAGGVVYSAVIDVASGDTIGVTVGTGSFDNGNDSVVVADATYTAIGGGAGGGNSAGHAGGSGGGGGGRSYSGGRGTDGQGHDGSAADHYTVGGYFVHRGGAGGGAGGPTAEGVNLNLAGETLRYADGGGGGSFRSAARNSNAYHPRRGGRSVTAGSAGGGGATA
ncbi:MAG: hypothetical protein OXI12_06695, partial [Gammaproteobacteria bacterium]|nr:hypothetical protein [Gammaproteobacteria bacterium]